MGKVKVRCQHSMLYTDIVLVKRIRRKREGYWTQQQTVCGECKKLLSLQYKKLRVPVEQNNG